MTTGVVNHMSYIQYLAGVLLKLKLSEQIVRTNQFPVFIFFSLLCVMIYFPLSCTKLGLLSVHNELHPAKLSLAKGRIALIFNYNCHIFCVEKLKVIIFRS